MKEIEKKITFTQNIKLKFPLQRIFYIIMQITDRVKFDSMNECM